MKKTPANLIRVRPLQAAKYGCLVLAAWMMAVSAAAYTLFPDAIVKTLGGGPLVLPNGPSAGYVDGAAIQDCQFNNPYACALDIDGNLLVADKNNNAIRLLEFQKDFCSTVLSNLNQPVGVVMDRARNLYVLNQGNGSLVKFDRFGFSSVLWNNLVSPTALTTDAVTNGVFANFYITEYGGSVKCLNLASGLMTVLVTNYFKQPGGIAVMDSGLLAISDTGNQTIRVLNPVTRSVANLAGFPGLAGYSDGPFNLARFSGPRHIARAPNGTLVVADQANHRFRLISPDGTVSTLYGVIWEKPSQPGVWPPGWWPGWLDGSVRYAEARDPMGVTVAADGTVYTTETGYHLVRQVTGTGLGIGGGGGGGGGGGVILPPIVSLPLGVSLPPGAVASPLSGYFPFGITITVTNPNNNPLFDNAVYYTTDGSEPTTNSFRVNMTNQVGTIVWRESLRDLSSLRIKAISNGYISETVSGQPASVNAIGVPCDVTAGIGSVVVVPVVLNLRPGQQVQSLQFRAEVTPQAGTPMLTQPLRVLDTNSFVPVVTTSGSEGAFSNGYVYTNGTVTVMGVRVLFSPSAKFQITDFGVVALLAVPIPASAIEGNRYEVRVLESSATSDAGQTAVSLTELLPSTIVISNLTYLVGDSAPGGGYNAGEFGNKRLDNADANNAFLASLGIRVPYQFSDVFDAMDAFPPDEAGQAGGDGQIRYLDWQITFFRSLRMPGDTDRWKRSWSAGGLRVAQLDSGASGSADLPAQVGVHSLSASATTDRIWNRQALLGALPVTRAVPGGTVDVPVYLKVVSGYSVAGMQFRALLTPETGAPMIGKSMQFIPAAGRPNSEYNELSVNDLSIGWSLGTFYSPLVGSNLLGTLRFTVPMGASMGSSYTVSFIYADGSPDMNTQYDFETLPATIWVLSEALRPPEVLPIEWKTNFFGSVSNPWATPEADPDGDGVTNLEAYRAGTNPVQLLLHTLTADWKTNTASFKLRWFGESGKKYGVEWAENPASSQWTSLTNNLPGFGDLLEVTDADRRENTRFYRVLIQP